MNGECCFKLHCLDPLDQATSVCHVRRHVYTTGSLSFCHPMDSMSNRTTVPVLQKHKRHTKMIPELIKVVHAFISYWNVEFDDFYSSGKLWNCCWWFIVYFSLQTPVPCCYHQPYPKQNKIVWMTDKPHITYILCAATKYSGQKF